MNAMYSERVSRGTIITVNDVSIMGCLRQSLKAKYNLHHNNTYYVLN